jgi:hypothetical protein
LYTQLGRVNKAKDMYSHALDGLEAVFGRSSNSIRISLQRWQFCAAIGVIALTSRRKTLL